MNRCYNERGKTIQELLCQFTKKINENVTLVNSQEERINYLLDQGVELETAKKIDELYRNGELGKLINDGLLNGINKKVNLSNDKVDEFTNKFTGDIASLESEIKEVAQKGTTTEVVTKTSKEFINSLLQEGQLSSMTIPIDGVDTSKTTFITGSPKNMK